MGVLWTVYENGYFMWSRSGTSQGSFGLVGHAGESSGPSPSGLRQIAAVSPLAPPAGLTAEQQQMLDAHNRERQNYPGVGPLQWSPELAQWAQEWAEGRAREGNINHRQDRTKNPFKPGEYVGENIFSSGKRRRPEPTPFNGGSVRRSGTITIKDRDGMAVPRQSAAGMYHRRTRRLPRAPRLLLLRPFYAG